MARTPQGDSGPCCLWPALHGGLCIADALLCQPHRQGTVDCVTVRSP